MFCRCCCCGRRIRPSVCRPSRFRTMRRPAIRRSIGRWAYCEQGPGLPRSPLTSSTGFDQVVPSSDEAVHQVSHSVIFFPALKKKINFSPSRRGTAPDSSGRRRGFFATRRGADQLPGLPLDSHMATLSALSLVSAEPCYQEIAVVESYQRGCMALFERTVVAEQEIPFRQGRVFPFDVHGAFRFRL